MEKFRVIQGSNGTVYAGNNYMCAMTAFSKAIKADRTNGVILLHDGKVKREHVGDAGESTERVE